MSCSERAGHLALGHEVVAYCPSCGDETPGVPYKMGTLDRAPSQLYLRTSPDQFTNLATLVGCDAGAAPHSLRVENDHGMVIVPNPVVPSAEPDDVPWGLVAVPVFVVCVLLARRRRPMEPRAVKL
jgi:hypothetical protein